MYFLLSENLTKSRFRDKNQKTVQWLSFFVQICHTIYRKEKIKEKKMERKNEKVFYTLEDKTNTEIHSYSDAEIRQNLKKYEKKSRPRRSLMLAGFVVFYMGAAHRTGRVCDCPADIARQHQGTR